MGRKKIRPKTYDGFWESFVEVRVLNVPDLSTNPVAVRLTAWRATASSSAHAAASHSVRVIMVKVEVKVILSISFCCVTSTDLCTT